MKYAKILLPDDWEQGSCSSCPFHYAEEVNCEKDGYIIGHCTLGNARGCPITTTYESDRIIRQLANFLSAAVYGGERPWESAFFKKFCAVCSGEEYTFSDGQKMRLYECDFVDGKCPHGSDVLWWVRQQIEEFRDGNSMEKITPQK